MASMPIISLQSIELRWNELFYFERIFFFLARQFRSFDSGSVRIKGVKTLYLSVVHSKYTASYTG